jgi:hypothetical protein
MLQLKILYLAVNYLGFALWLPCLITLVMHSNQMSILLKVLYCRVQDYFTSKWLEWLIHKRDWLHTPHFGFPFGLSYAKLFVLGLFKFCVTLLLIFTVTSRLYVCSGPCVSNAIAIVITALFHMAATEMPNLVLHQKWNQLCMQSSECHYVDTLWFKFMRTPVSPVPVWTGKCCSFLCVVFLCFVTNLNLYRISSFKRSWELLIGVSTCQSDLSTTLKAVK